jgi:hypothetical protein
VERAADVERAANEDGPQHKKKKSGDDDDKSPDDDREDMVVDVLGGGHAHKKDEQKKKKKKRRGAKRNKEGSGVWSIRRDLRAARAQTSNDFQSNDTPPDPTRPPA